MNNFRKAIFKAAKLLEVEILFGDNLSNLTCAVYCLLLTAIVPGLICISISYREPEFPYED